MDFVAKLSGLGLPRADSQQEQLCISDWTRGFEDFVCRNSTRQYFLRVPLQFLFACLATSWQCPSLLVTCSRPQDQLGKASAEPN